VLSGGALGRAVVPTISRGLEVSSHMDVNAIDRGRVFGAASAYLKEKPLTIISASSPRSAGGKHDYFSEGD
jgi:hypothetical protein